MKRFQINPEPNWGPRKMGTAGISFDDDPKRVRNQGRKRRKNNGESVEEASDNKSPKIDE